MATIHCPICGGTDIRETNTAIAFLRVTEWEIEDGEPTPAEYDTDVDADWEITDSKNPYRCHSTPATCSWEGTLDELEVRE